MALLTVTPAPLPSPQVVGSAFVHQYYHILHQTPEQVYRFYQDSSILSRPDSDGVMTSVTSLQAINDKIVSLDFKDYFTKIETVDSQMSYKNGVFIVVTGSLTGLDNVWHKFAQSFFLAPQENGGFFVLNDVFRFVNEKQPAEINQLLVNGTFNDAPKASLTAEPEPASVQEHHVVDLATPLSEGDADNGEEVFIPSENGGSGVEDEVDVDPPVHGSQSDTQRVSETIVSVVEEDAPKKSYASIVKVTKGSPSPKPVYVPATKAKPAPSNTEKPVVASTAPACATETPVPDNKTGPEKNSHEVEGHSIYIRNLPLNATPEHVEEEFKKFGSIKLGGVQVRSHKTERFCFGFVEFELQKSMQDAIEASPILIGGRQAYIEEKRTTTRVVNGIVTNGGGGRGRFMSGRVGFRNDSFRGRGGYGGNMGGYRRNEFRNRGEFTGRGRGQAVRAADGYRQRVFQNGDARNGQSAGPK